MKKLLVLFLAVLMALSLTACSGGKDNEPTGETGKVYYLNFKPEADEAWQELAKKYTELTGVEVKVVTAAADGAIATTQAEAYLNSLE